MRSRVDPDARSAPPARERGGRTISPSNARRVNDRIRCSEWHALQSNLAINFWRSELDAGVACASLHPEVGQSRASERLGALATARESDGTLSLVLMIASDMDAPGQRRVLSEQSTRQIALPLMGPLPRLR